MHEGVARRVLLVQAYDVADPATPVWTDDDRAWATRLAIETAPPAADDAAFIALRAEHALQRLAPRLPTAARWLARPLWRPAWLGVAAAAGALAGLAVDAVGNSQRINLLDPPILAVLAWNLLVYLLLALHGLRAWRPRTDARAGFATRAAARLMALGRRVPRHAVDERSSAALRGFAAAWGRLGAPLAGVRAAALLHAGAAGLAAGLAGGLYLRGLVLDYRVGWESTFLDAGQVHALLAVVFAPASALSGIPLPDVAALDALRTVHGSVTPGGPGASWIHLDALTLALVVILPRAALAVAGAARAAWRARRLPVPLAAPYFQQLLRERHGGVARVAVMPYAATLGGQAALGLRAVLARVYGDACELSVAAPAPFGAEDEALPAPLPGCALRLVVFDLTATPEPEHHGRYVRALVAQAPGLPVAVVVDEAAFVRRFGAGPRLEQRRAAWKGWTVEGVAAPVCVDLDRPDLPAAAAALQRALDAASRTAG